MNIKKLSVKNLRNISTAELEFSPTINVIQGGNGAGKTSLLEAIYLLARARSFRNAKSQKLIQNNQSSLTLFALTESENGVQTRIGLRKEGGQNLIKINGKRVNKLSTLATNLPIALITPHSHRIIEEGPEYRRRLLNWGVFHVEHRYRDLLAKYNRVLAQRNASIKSRKTDLKLWDIQMDIHAEEIKNLQEAYVLTWNKMFKRVSKDVGFLSRITIKHVQGWGKGMTLKDALNKKRDIDLGRGFTSVGSHRSDIQLSLDGSQVKNQLSRGQQKFLVTLLMLAQSKIKFDLEMEKTVILFDDFQSELDRITQQNLLGIIQDEACQAFMTVIEKNMDIENRLGSDDKMFHVEHGSFSCMN